MFTITKDFHFSASHQLEGLPDTHQCARLHGHNYIVRIELTAHNEDLNGVGFVLDYGELKPVGEWLDSQFDHRHLNDRVPFNTTAELLARHIRWMVPELVDIPSGVDVGVGVSETPKSWAWFR